VGETINKHVVHSLLKQILIPYYIKIRNKKMIWILEKQNQKSCGFLRLSPIGDPFGNPNPKWVSNTIPIASNRVSIQKTLFRYQERHNPNLGILSPRDPFAESVFF